MSESTSPQTGYRPWYLEKKETLRGAFPFLNKLGSVKDINSEKPLPPWTSADIDQFAKEDPVYGPQVLKTRSVAQASVIGAAVGGFGSAAYCLRYSKTPAGSALVLAIGSVASWTLTEEVASAAYGLYKFSPTDANIKFLEWWQKKQQS